MSKWEICKNCRGEGYRKYLDEHVYHGYGEIDYWYDDCKSCDGTGKIDVSKVVEPDKEWEDELAMEEGMLNGIDAYNEVKGY